jgi:hypothetical protein
MDKPLILGITGKAGSGKDTVASLLQLFEISKGKKAEVLAAATYHTFEQRCQVLKTNRFKESSLYRDSFALPLKEITSIILNCSINKLEDREFKNSQIPVELIPDKVHDDLPFTVRNLMQYLGTELFREHYSTNLWVNMLLNRVKNSKNDVIVTDVRFKNEAAAIHKNNGIVISVVRPWHNNDVDTHPSELMQGITPYVTIVNDEDIQTLVDKVEKLYEAYAYYKRQDSILDSFGRLNTFL